jgi:ParB family chromosome partitioning protein
VAENLTDEEVRAYRIADNRTHDFTSWDYPELAIQLDDLADEFGDVLALQDWQALSDDFDMSLDIDDDTGTRLDPNAGFHVTVVFATAEDALRADEALIALPGVVDVRHKNVIGQ